MNSPEVNGLGLRDRKCNWHCLTSSHSRKPLRWSRWNIISFSFLLQTMATVPQLCALNEHAVLQCAKTNDWLIENTVYSYCGCGFVQSKCVIHRELSHYWHCSSLTNSHLYKYNVFVCVKVNCKKSLHCWAHSLSDTSISHLKPMY